MIPIPQYNKGQIVFTKFPANRDLEAQFEICEQPSAIIYWNGEEWIGNIQYSGRYINTHLIYPERILHQKELRSEPINPARVLKWCDKIKKYTIDDRNYSCGN